MHSNPQVSWGNTFDPDIILCDVRKDGMEMATVIIMLIILMLAILGIRSSLKHFRGEGGCCGGGSVPKQSKKLKNSVMKKVVFIEGMHCDNCKNSVERNINRLNGVSAKVNLKKNQAVVEMEQKIDDSMLIEAVESAGFKVVKIEA